MRLLLTKYFIVLSLISCNTTKNILGEYRTVINDHSTFEIDLLDSGKFEYKSRLGLTEKLSYGSFEYEKRKLILTSHPEVTKENGIVKAEFNERLNGYTLKFLNFDGVRSFKNLDILINDSIKIKTDDYGLVKFQGNLHNLYVEFLPHCVFFYDFESSKMNNYSIYLSPSNGTAIVLRGERFKVTKRGIKFGKMWLRKT